MSDPLPGCVGVEPLRGRFEPWQLEVAADPARLAALLAEHGSPLNLLNPEPMARNIDGLRAAAREHGLELEVFFARKANKGLCFVERRARTGCRGRCRQRERASPGPRLRRRAGEADRHRGGEAESLLELWSMRASPWRSTTRMSSTS